METNLKGVGLDCGTMTLVSARQTPTGVVNKRIRDAFLDLPKDAKKMLKLSGADFVEREDDIIILGDMALETANVFGKEVRRPLRGGIISPDEIDSIEVLGLLVKHILGKPIVDNEVCYFCVPAEPIDKIDRDIVYHRGVFEKIISECGYMPIASNEAMGIIYSETAGEGFSGIGISCGAGMTNVALAVNTIEAMSFSVERAGDWIDRGAAKSLGSTQARMCILKEKGIDLTNPKGREQEAIAYYYRAMIEYVLDHIAKRFMAVRNQFALPKPIPIVVSGGSSLAGGFLSFFEKVFETKRKRFPIEISEIRQAGDPMTAVADGMLVQAIQES